MVFLSKSLEGEGEGGRPGARAEQLLRGGGVTARPICCSASRLRCRFSPSPYFSPRPLFPLILLFPSPCPPPLAFPSSPCHSPYP